MTDFILQEHTLLLRALVMPVRLAESAK